MYALKGKVALVTGTSNKKGQGRAIALRLAQEGADLVVTDKPRTLESFDPWDREEGWRGLESLVKEIETLGHRANLLRSSSDAEDKIKPAYLLRQPYLRWGNPQESLSQAPEYSDRLYLNEHGYRVKNFSRGGHPYQHNATAIFT